MTELLPAEQQALIDEARASIRTAFVNNDPVAIHYGLAQRLLNEMERLIRADKTAALQAEHERDCAIENVKRLTLILAQVHALANPRLVLATNGAEIVKLTGEFAPAEPNDVARPCACDEPLRETCMCEYVRAGISCRLTGSVSTRTAPP